MNKQKFLKELEKRLVILSASERQDTINEYRDIIEEKVKHGKTEEEAVKEFGSIDELTKEILDAYKINPEYQNHKSDAGDKAKELVETTEDWIRKGAHKLSEVTDEVTKNLNNSSIEFTTEKVFELVIKIILLLLALALLKLPFYLISELGSGILSIGFGPFHWISEVAWKLVTEVLYLGVCVLLIYTAVSRFLKNETKPKQPEKEMKQKTTTKATPKEEKKKEVKEVPKKKEIKNDGVGNLIITLIKVWVSIIIFLPLCFLQIGLWIALAFTIYLMIKGVEFIGILLLLVGISSIIFTFCNLIYRLMFTSKKVTFAISSFIIGMMITIVGILMTFDYFSNCTYYNDLPQDQFPTNTISFQEEITETTKILGENVTYVIDNNMEDQKVLIEVTYYKDYGIPEERRNHNRIYFTTNHDHFNWNQDIERHILEPLKKKKFYNYGKLDDMQIQVYTNAKTKDLLS